MAVSVKRIKSLILLGLLAIGLLIVVILHTEIIRTTLSLLGLRSDVPQIVAAQADCGSGFVMPLAHRGAYGDLPIWRIDCAPVNKISVWHTTPRARRSVVMANEAKVEVSNSVTGLVTKTDIGLRFGVNRIAVVAEGQTSALPYASIQGVPRYWLPTRKQQGAIPGYVGNPAAAISDFWVVRAQRRIAEPQAFAIGRSRNKSLWQVSTSPDCAEYIQALQRNECWENSKKLNTSQSGYGHSATSEQGELRDLNDAFKRELTITASPAGLNFEFEVCIHQNLPVAQHVRLQSVRASEGLARIFGLETFHQVPVVVDKIARSDLLKRSNSPFSGCHVVKGAGTLPLGEISFSNGDFLKMKGDQLTIRGFGPGFASKGPTGTISEDESKIIWEGDFGTEGQLMINDWDAQDLSDIATQDPQTVAQDKTDKVPNLVVTGTALVDLLPVEMKATFRGLAATVPVLLLVIIVYHRRNKRGFARTKHALIGLAAFLVSMALQPLLLAWTAQIMEALVETLERLNLGKVAARTHLQISTAQFAPMAVIAAAAILPIVNRSEQGQQIGEENPQFWIWRLLAVMALIAAAVVVLNFMVTERAAGAVLRWFAAWIAISFVVALITLLFVARPFVGSSAAWRFAAIGACAMIFIPLVPAVAGTVDLLAELGASLPQSPFDITRWLPRAALESIHTWLPNLAMFILYILLIRTLLEVTVDFMPRSWRFPVLKVWQWVCVAVLAGAITLPMFSDLAEGARQFDVATYQQLGQFHDYSVYLALAAPFGILATRQPQAPDPPFHPDPDADALAATMFAGYAIVWHSGSFGTLWVFILVALAYLGLTKIALNKTEESQTFTVTKGLGTNLIKVLKSNALLKARGKELDKLYTEGKIEWGNLQEAHDAINETSKNVHKELGLQPGEAKRRLLGNGPMSTPFKNGLLGAMLGLIVALLVEASSTIALAEILTGEQSWWRPLVDLTISLQSSNPETLGDGNEVLSFLTVAIRVFSYWPVVGFVFGVLFHRLRGDDGFTKGLVFAALMVLLLAISGVATGSLGADAKELRNSFITFAFLVLFIVATGALVFDLLSIHQHGLRLSSISRIYGVATLMSYATFLTLLAAIQSVVGIFRMFAAG